MKKQSGSGGGEWVAFTGRSDARDAVEQHTVRTQAADVAGNEFGERVVDQSPKREFDPVGGQGQGRAEPDVGQQRQGQRVIRPAGQEAQQSDGLGQILPSQGVQRKLPRSAHQVARVAARVDGSLVNQLDGVRTLLQATPVLFHRPGVDHLVGQESSGESQGEWQAAEAVGDGGRVLGGTRSRGEIAQDLSRLLARQDIHVQRLGGGPPVAGGLPRGHKDSSTRAGTQPSAVPQHRRIIGVVQHQQPRDVGTVEAVSDQVSGRA